MRAQQAARAKVTVNGCAASCADVRASVRPARMRSAWIVRHPVGLRLLACALATSLGAAWSDSDPAARRPQAQADHHLGPEPKREIHRVVTLAPSLTELVLALGAGERLVGVTRFDDDPRVTSLPRVGGYNDPEPEAVLRLAPDLILAQPAPENRGPVEALARIGVPIDAFTLGSMAEIQSALLAVGARLGLSAKAAALVQELTLHRGEMRARSPAKGERVLLVFGLDPLVVAGRGGFAGELLEDTGAINALDDPRPFVRVSAEAAVAAHPSRILLCGVDAPRGRPALPGLPDSLVTTLPGTALLHPGPRLVEALDQLADALARAEPR